MEEAEEGQADISYYVIGQKNTYLMVAWEGLGLMLMALKMEEWGSQPRNVGSLWKLEKPKKRILP